jgi:hypothetical protein
MKLSKIIFLLALAFCVFGITLGVGLKNAKLIGEVVVLSVVWLTIASGVYTAEKRKQSTKK